MEGLGDEEGITRKFETSQAPGTHPPLIKDTVTLHLSYFHAF